MSSSASRTREWRRRHAAGKVQLLVEVNEIDVAEMLLAHGLLQPADADDRGALARAVELALSVLVTASRHGLR